MSERMHDLADLSQEVSRRVDIQLRRPILNSITSVLGNLNFSSRRLPIEEYVERDPRGWIGLFLPGKVTIRRVSDSGDLDRTIFEIEHSFPKGEARERQAIGAESLRLTISGEGDVDMLLKRWSGTQYYYKDLGAYPSQPDTTQKPDEYLYARIINGQVTLYGSPSERKKGNVLKAESSRDYIRRDALADISNLLGRFPTR